MTDLIEVPEVSHASLFRKMAERIDHNKDSTFGGAIVIVPPGSAGEPIELLMLDSSGNAAQFWSTIKTRIELVLAELNEQSRVVQGFGGRR